VEIERKARIRDYHMKPERGGICPTARLRCQQVLRVPNGRYALPAYRFFLRFLRRHLESSPSYSADWRVVHRKPQNLAASFLLSRRNHRACPPIQRPQKITFAEMHASGVRGLLIYCSDYRCSHWTAISGGRWTDGARLSDSEPPYTCHACGRRGADVRPDWQSAETYAWQGIW
jgi:hypothetical protein